MVPEGKESPLHQARRSPRGTLHANPPEPLESTCFTP